MPNNRRGNIPIPEQPIRARDIDERERLMREARDRIRHLSETMVTPDEVAPPVEQEDLWNSYLTSAYARYAVNCTDGSTMLITDTEGDMNKNRKLDVKTIKQLSVSVEPVTNVTRSMFVKLHALKRLIEVSEDDFEKKKLKETIRALRKKIKSRSVRTYYRHKLSGASSYLSNGNVDRMPKGKTNDDRSYILGRIREKMHHYRLVNIRPEETVKRFYQSPYKMIAGVHKRSGVIKKFNDTYRYDLIRSEKYVTPNADYVGVEIEFISRTSWRGVEQALVKAGLYNYVFLKQDGSIEWDRSGADPDCWCEGDGCGDCDDSGQTGIEINILAKESDIMDIVKRTCDVLEACDCYTNDSCGVHVHIDCRSRDRKRAFRRLVDLQSIMKKIVNTERLSNSYCKMNENNNWDESSRDRYLAINGQSAYASHRTIEVRLYHGTVDGEEINNWLKLLLGVVNYRCSDGINLNDNLDCLNGIVEENTINYYKKRIGA